MYPCDAAQVLYDVDAKEGKEELEMLFSYFIATVAQLVGPVVDYGNFNMTNHVTAEYVKTADNKCTIGVTFIQRNDESSIAWDKSIVQTESGTPVKVIDDIEYAELPADGNLVKGVSLFASRATNDIVWEPRTSYIFISPEPRFKFDTAVAVYVDDALDHVEKKTIYCDVDACECSTKSYPKRRL